MTRPLPFTQAAIKRAVSALEAVGKTVQGVEVLPSGAFRVLTATQGDQQPLTDLERWERDNGHRAA